MPANVQAVRSWVTSRKDTFIGQTLTLATGAGLAQLITVMAAPVLSRLYTPADFGVLGVFLSLLMPIIAIASLKYEVAIVTARNWPEAANILGLGGLITILIAFTTMAIAWQAAPRLAGLLGSPELEPFLWLIPAGVVFGGAHRLGLFWATRKSHFAMAASADVARAGSTVLVQTSLGMMSFASIGLIAGQLFGHVVGALTLITRILMEDLAQIRSHLSWRRIKAMAVRYKDFARFQSPKALLNSATATLPPILLLSFFDPVVARLYLFTHRILMMPMTLIGNAVNRVFLKNASEKQRAREQTFSLWWRTTCAMALMGAVACTVLVAVGPALFEFVFGRGWREAGYFAGWMSLWIMFLLAAVPAQSIFVIKGRQKLLLIFEIVYLAPRILVIPAASLFGTARDAIMGLSLAGVLFNMVVIAVAYRLCARTGAAQ